MLDPDLQHLVHRALRSRGCCAKYPTPEARIALLQLLERYQHTRHVPHELRQQLVEWAATVAP